MHHNLLFDLDQTLLDFHASEHIALKMIMERNHLVFKEEYYHFFKQVNKCDGFTCTLAHSYNLAATGEADKLHKNNVEL